MSNPQQFRHILVIEDQKARRIISLEDDSYAIGRESSNSIIIYERQVSRHHATLIKEKDPNTDHYSYRIIDGNLEGVRSTNGLVINGKYCFSHELSHGDVVVFGGHAKASYYVISNALEEIDLFRLNKLQIEQLNKVKSVLEEPLRKTTISNKELEELSQEDLIRLASFPELSPNPIIEINFQGKITYTNPAARLKFEDLYQAHLEHPILKELLNQSQNRKGNLLLRELKIGDAFFEQYVHYLSDSHLIRSYIFDITERKRSEFMLQHQAFHDRLTGLPNRTFFQEQLSNLLSNPNQSDDILAVMFLDVDGFKNINDTLGHTLGDQVLKAFAERLTTCLRSGDIVARWGGDEFTLLFPAVKNAENTVTLAQRILDALKQPFEIEQQQLYIKSSIGIAIYPQDGEDVETLLKNADAALYRAKERGRNHYRFYSPTMTSKASLLFKLENLLYQALEQEELSLYYQPQIKIDTGEITGMEALLRWHNAELGAVSPLKLIPLAEKTDLIFPIGEWVLKTACQQNLDWQKAGLPVCPIAVNFSPRQFQQPNLINMIVKILQDTGLAPQFLEVEITETTLMQNANFARQALQDLQQLGIQISMDDFGTGYSSLSYLKKFPLNTLKIDRSFVQELTNNPQDTAIISAVISLGQNFNLRVVAEGVETLQQLELLRSLHCQEIQGYWFSRPLKAEDATQFLIQSVQT
jgi:diguanylate cyclase (GGDEF)-like protein